MHLYTSPNFGQRPANFVDKTYGGATAYVSFETDYLWMKFDVLRQHANESEIYAMAAREASAMCNGGSGRCTISKVSMLLGACAGPLALANGTAAGGLSMAAALLEGADAIAHHDGSNLVQTIGTEIVGAAADSVLPGVGGPVVDGVDLVVDLGSLSALEASYLEGARTSVNRRLEGWRQIEGSFANEQRWGSTLPWINPILP